MKHNPYQLHSQLSATIKAAAHVRQQLESGRLSRLGRLCRQLQHALLVFRSTCILEQIRG